MEILEALGNIGFDWRIALANLFNFLLVFWVLKYFLFKPLAETLNERKQKIQTGLDNFEKSKTLKAEAEKEKETILRQARGEATKLVNTAREKERQIIDEASDKADETAQKIIHDANAAAVSKQAEMENEFKEKAADSVVLAAEKLIQEKLDKDSSNKLAKHYLDQALFEGSEMSEKSAD